MSMPHGNTDDLREQNVQAAELPRTITVTVNGKELTGEAEPRMLLADFLREQADCLSVQLGCEHGVCGCCTVLLDGRSVRSCLMFAVQAHGRSIETAEGLSDDPSRLHPIQEAFWEEHGLQCGFCTSAMMLRAKEILASGEPLSREQIREKISGILCRCTGYQNIITSIQTAARKMAEQQGRTDGAGGS